MSSLTPINDLTISETSNINVSHLKNLSHRTYIGNYELDPHFLVIIFNIAQKNTNINSYLLNARFFDASRANRLEIIKNINFFNLLSDNEMKQLLPENIFNEVKNISNKDRINFEDVAFIKRAADKFKDVHNYLKNKNFYSLVHESPQPLLEIQNIIISKEFKSILAKNSTPHAQYLQYVRGGHHYSIFRHWVI